MSNISAIIPGHDEQLAGDVLTTLTVNYRWRRIIASLLWPMLFDAFWTGTETQRQDAKNKATDLIADLYTAETTLTQYHGALIARESFHTVTTTELGFDLETDSGGFLHDTDGYWPGVTPPNIEIPSGLGGWYWCYAQFFVSSSTNTFRGWLSTSGQWPDHRIAHTLEQQSEGGIYLVSGAALLGAGDKLFATAQSNAGTVELVNFPPKFPYSCLVGLYRIGDAAPA